MKFRKKPAVVDAIQFTGENKFQIAEFCKGTKFDMHFNVESIQIDTLEGTMTASLGDWIIKGVKGEFYPCKPDIFVMTYEPAEQT